MARWQIANRPSSPSFSALRRRTAVRSYRPSPPARHPDPAKREKDLALRFCGGTSPTAGFLAEFTLSPFAALTAVPGRGANGLRMTDPSAVAPPGNKDPSRQA